MTSDAAVELPGLHGNVLWGILAGVFAVGSQSLLLSPLLKDIAVTFQVSERETAYASLAYGLTLAVSAPLTGLLSDLLSRRHMLLGGLIGVMLAGILAAASGSIGILILSQALAGLAAGCFLPSAYALVGDRVPFAERARVMGRVFFGWAIAMVVGVPLGGIVGEHFGWRAALGTIAAMALIAAFLLSLSLEARPISYPSLGDAGRRLRHARMAVVAAKRARPLLFVNFLNMMGFFGIYTFLGSFARDRFDFGADEAGLLVICYGAGQAVITLNGHLVDRIGKGPALMGGLAAVGCFQALMPQTIHVGWPALALLLTLWGAFQGAAVTALTTLVTQRSDTARGVITSLMSCTTYLGVAVGSGLMGVLYEQSGYDAVGFACCLANLLGALMIWRTRPDRPA